MDQRLNPVALVVIDEQGKRQPGFMLRAGDFIERTDYDHALRVLEVRVVAKPQPLPLWLRLRRWWEGRRGGREAQA